jgi:Copper binding periplasmic protein CusF
MKPPRALAALLAILAAFVGELSPLRAAPACCAAEPEPSPTPAATATPAAPPLGHPLRGVIIDVLPEKSALLVKHEEIPGVMSAMTMLLKVDAPTLAAAQKDAAITATLVKKPDGWWLENVAPAP